MFIYKENLNGRRNELLQLRKEVLSRIGKLSYKGEQGYHLRFYSDKKQIYITVPGDRAKGKYLSCDERPLAKQIANFEYLNKLIGLIDHELKYIDCLIKCYSTGLAEDYFGSLSKGRQNLVVPIRLTDEQFIQKWISKQYAGRKFEDGEAEFYTEKNERVRSKSEILIANALAKFNVPYKYECPIVLNGLGVIHPDFTALNVKRRKVFYWEHLGKMDDIDYARKNVYRINMYEKNGLYPGDSLIITRETSTMPLDVKLLDQIIRHYLIE